MKCEHCKKTYDIKYGSGRFCSRQCASAYSSLINRKETNKKISETARLKRNEKDVNICISCNSASVKTSRSNYCAICASFLKYVKFFAKLGVFDKNIRSANAKALDILKHEYFDNELSLTDIKEKYGLRINSTHFFLKKNGICLRSLDDAQHISYKNGKLIGTSNFKYVSGWHRTWDNKNVFLRSSYEFDYAKQLDDYKIKYDVEKIRIVYYDSIVEKNRIAIADFYLPDLNMIVEIKSSYTFNLINMQDKFKEYQKLGFKTKLILDKIESNIINF